MPALVPQERRDPAIAIPAELFGQADDRTRQGVLVITADEVLACSPSATMRQIG